MVFWRSENRWRALGANGSEIWIVDIGQAIDHLEPLIRDYGVVVVTIVLTFESFGAPLPGESLLIVASVLAGRGDVSFPWLLLCSWLGAVLGDNIGYIIGRVLGRSVVLRHGKKIGLDADRLKKIEDVFARFGPITVAFARFVNILRQLNGIVAGTLRMDWRRFLIFNALGGALWVLVWGFAGFYLGKHLSNITTFARDLGMVGAIVVAAILLLALLYAFRRAEKS
jgi:membrane protein DedA with SNARE-associated domain